MPIDSLSEDLPVLSTGGIGTGIGWIVARWMDRRHDDKRLQSADANALLERALSRIDALEANDSEKGALLSELSRDLGRAEGRHHSDAATIRSLETRLDTALRRIDHLEEKMYSIRGERDYLREAMQRASEDPASAHCMIIQALEHTTPDHHE